MSYSEAQNIYSCVFRTQSTPIFPPNFQHRNEQQNLVHIIPSCHAASNLMCAQRCHQDVNLCLAVQGTFRSRLPGVLATVVLESPAYLRILGRFPRDGAHMRCLAQRNMISVPHATSLQPYTHGKWSPSCRDGFPKCSQTISSSVPGTQMESQHLEEPVPQLEVCGHSRSS